MTNQEVARDFISRMFPGQGFVEMTKVSKFIGINEKTGRNWLCDEKYPLPTEKNGGKRLVAVPALIDWYAKRLEAAAHVPAAAAVPASESVKRGRGRPRKVAQKGGV